MRKTANRLIYVVRLHADPLHPAVSPMISMTTYALLPAKLSDAYADMFSLCPYLMERVPLFGDPIDMPRERSSQTCVQSGVKSEANIILPMIVDFMILYCSGSKITDP